MRILFVTRGFPNESDPMLGNYEAIQAKALAKRGNQVLYLSLLKYRSAFHLFDKDRFDLRNIDGVEVLDYTGIIPYFIKISFVQKWFHEHAWKKAFRFLTQKFGRPDVINSHSLYVSRFAVPLKDWFGIPLVFTEHWSALNQTDISDDFKTLGNAYQKADAVISVSHALASNLKRHFNVDSIVIHNMVADSFFSYKRIEKGNDTFRFISVGSLRPIKAFDVLIKAFALSAFNDNVFLDIIGEGEEEEKLKSLIEDNGLVGKVTLQGVKNPVEVRRMLGESNAFALASNSETFGIAYIEAMAMGLPVIATTCGGPEEFVNGKNGLLVPVGDVEKLSAAMVYMREHAVEYDGDSISRECFEHFSEQKISERIEGVFKSCIGI